jgi:hypothetical protein
MAKREKQVKLECTGWLDSSDIWLFCLEKDVFRVRMRDCPSINVLVRVAHITPVNKVGRRLVLIFQFTLKLHALLISNNAGNVDTKDESNCSQAIRTRRLTTLLTGTKHLFYEKIIRNTTVCQQWGDASLHTARFYELYNRSPEVDLSIKLLLLKLLLLT